MFYDIDYSFQTITRKLNMNKKLFDYATKRQFHGWSNKNKTELCYDLNKTQYYKHNSSHIGPSLGGNPLKLLAIVIFHSTHGKNV